MQLSTCLILATAFFCSGSLLAGHKITTNFGHLQKVRLYSQSEELAAMVVFDENTPKNSCGNHTYFIARNDPGKDQLIQLIMTQYYAPQNRPVSVEDVGKSCSLYGGSVISEIELIMK